MTLDDLRMFEVRLPVHSWRALYRDLPEGAHADLRQQLATGVTLAPQAGVPTFDELVEAMSRTCLDHSCSLEGWDESCPECVAARMLWRLAQR